MDAIARAFLSLDGLSVGDAFGERFFGPTHEVLQRISRRELPDAPWTYTDDTEMAWLAAITRKASDRARCFHRAIV